MEYESRYGLPIQTVMYIDPITTRLAANEAEARLLESPWDVELRAQLVSCYVCNSLKADKVKHIVWFIENAPDWSFCGSYVFYLNREDHGYDELKDLWLAKIAQSAELRRRLNAYLFFAHAKEPELNKYFQEFFEGNESHVWVRALADLDKPEATWFDEVIAVESAKPLADKQTIESLTELAAADVWDDLAHGEISRDQFDSMRSQFESSPSPDMVPALAAYSWSHNKEQSSIGFDPELTLFRFKLACWVVRHIPSSMCAFNPFFMEPFTDPIQGTIFPEIRNNPLTKPVKFLADLWIAQLQRFPEDKALTKNAARFSGRIHLLLPEADRRMREQLRKTDMGKRAIKNRFR